MSAVTKPRKSRANKPSPKSLADLPANCPPEVAELPAMASLDELAAFCGINISTVRRAIDAGELRAVRIARSVRIPRSAVANWLGGV
jgi:excisionase family DNA binding protein